MSKHLWEAVECGVDEWFLGCREGEGPGDGYHPFEDIGHGSECKEIAERLAESFNKMRLTPSAAHSGPLKVCTNCEFAGSDSEFDKHECVEER